MSGVSNKPFPTYFGAVTAAEHVFENVQKCFKIMIFKLENRISMINSRSDKNYFDQATFAKKLLDLAVEISAEISFAISSSF